MNKYLSFHPPGFNEIITSSLEKGLKSFKTLQQGSDYTVYTSDSLLSKVQEISFCETTYLLFKTTTPEILTLIRWVESNFDQIMRVIVHNFPPTASFRVVVTGNFKSKDQFNHQVERVHAKLEGAGVIIDKAQPDFEIRISVKGDIGFTGVRLTKPAEFIDNLQKGSIRKEIASLLIRLTNPSKEDVFMDPMCGSGLVPILRAKEFPYTYIYAIDQKTGSISEKIKGSPLKLEDFQIINSDIFNNELIQKLKPMPNKIIVDPPWGLIEDIDDIVGFYSKLLVQLRTFVAENSILIIISGRKSELLTALSQNSEAWRQEGHWESEISGRPATVLKLRA